VGFQYLFLKIIRFENLQNSNRTGTVLNEIDLFVYYESMERNLLKPIYDCRCNGRLQTKRFTRLTHTGSVVELEHSKIKTRLTNEKFASVKGECEI
jgi:hypothetical protein